MENFTLQDLAAAQRQHDVSSKVIFALESGDETTTTCVFFTIFLVSGQDLLSLLARKKGAYRAVCGSRVLCTRGAELSA